MAARGISQFEFARTFGLDQSSVSRYLGGREPRLSVYLKMVAKYPELGA
jgi:predicted transcriptional regulator